MNTVAVDYVPVLIQFALAAGFVGLTMVVTHFIGPSRKSAVKDANFECGIPTYGNARIPFSVKYFLVAILFVIFDVEVIFLYPWAVNFREMGMEGLWKMALFMGLLLVGFFYVVRKGALDWE